MTTPKDTWISIKDAMPPKEIPNGFYLIGTDKWNNPHEIIYENDMLLKITGAFPIELTFWMILPKPKPTKMEENKIPTAKEMLNRVELLWLEESVEQDVLNFALEFAKMHVKVALKTVLTEFSTNENGEVLEDYFTDHLKSIIDTYSLENIK